MIKKVSEQRLEQIKSNSEVRDKIDLIGALVKEVQEELGMGFVILANQDTNEDTVSLYENFILSAVDEQEEKLLYKVSATYLAFEKSALETMRHYVVVREEELRKREEELVLEKESEVGNEE